MALDSFYKETEIPDQKYIDEINEIYNSNKDIYSHLNILQHFASQSTSVEYIGEYKDEIISTCIHGLYFNCDKQKYFIGPLKKKLEGLAKCLKIKKVDSLEKIDLLYTTSNNFQEYKKKVNKYIFMEGKHIINDKDWKCMYEHNVTILEKKYYHIEINRKIYQVKSTEFLRVSHKEFSNLNIRSDLGELERISSLLNELSNLVKTPVITCYGISHGGFLAFECSSSFKKISILPEDKNIKYNIEMHKPQNIVFDKIRSNILFIDKMYENNVTINYDEIIVGSENKILKSNYAHTYKLKDSVYWVYIPKHIFEQFQNEFHYFINGNVLEYDNLLHYTMIVKNAGDEFEKVLQENLPYFDRWTILDTGSTDNTISIIKKVLKNKKGNLYQEPFINFRDSRNRCLDLAGKSCKYNIMLDDTYVIRGKLREFLQTVRGDQFADSYSMYLTSNDVQYNSNRITKADRNLRYIYRLHEVIDYKNNVNVIVPFEHSNLFDYRSDYMEARTNDRKEYDLKVLFEEIDENPDDPRAYYYVGQTYSCMGNHEKAYEYFLKRAHHPVEGLLQEKIDAIFEAARKANFELNKPWEECEKLYQWAYSLDIERPDSLYFLGIHYYLEDNNSKIAYDYFKKAFETGYPIHRQYSLKPTLSFHFLPKLLAPMCYTYEEFSLGEKVCELYLKNNKSDADGYQTIFSWHNIYIALNKRTEKRMLPYYSSKPILCILADGGYKEWSGSSINKEGVGGSETWVIETARYIAKHSNYYVMVFCQCKEVEIFEDVEYRPLHEFFNVCMNYYIKECIISRYSEYIPTAIHSHIENIYFIMHDLGPSGNVIPMHSKLKKVICLTDWHVKYFLQSFPALKDITVSSHYGIDFTRFKQEMKKVPNSFIYSSFPNRGLLYLLRHWKMIQKNIKDATLHIFCDVENKWSNDNFPEMMKEIKERLKTKDNSISYYGWVNKQTLADAWSKADIWLYPCVFAETFCLTALEAAMTKTLAVTNDLGALVETVGNRGIIIKGDASTEEWMKSAIDAILRAKKKEYIETNYSWAITHSWENQTKQLLYKYIGNVRISEDGIPEYWINYLNQFTFKQPINNTYDKLAIIIEPRKHPLFKQVIYNFMNILAPRGWGLKIYHSENNKDDIQILKQNYPNVLTNILPITFSFDDYSRLLKSPSFWKEQEYENILIFQTDCLLNRYFGDDFLQYDYVGAPWKQYLESNESYPLVGNGGLSLRRKSAMLRICEDEEYTKGNEGQEDVFFSCYLQYKAGFYVPSFSKASLFASEQMLVPNSAGFHAIYKYTNHKLVKVILNDLQGRNS